MPFDEEEDSLEVKKSGLKQVSSKKSIFDGIPKKPSQQDFNEKVHQVQDQANSYKLTGATLAKEFMDLVQDKTLNRNKSVIVKELEKELLSKMINFASTVNKDPNEEEGVGSLAIIALLLKTVLIQKNAINDLEYSNSLHEKKITELSLLINKEKSGS